MQPTRRTFHRAVLSVLRRATAGVPSTAAASPAATSRPAERLEPRRLLTTTLDYLPEGAIASELDPEGPLPEGAVYVDSLDNLDGTYSSGAVFEMLRLGYDLADDPRAGASDVFDARERLADDPALWGQGVEPFDPATRAANLSISGRLFDGIDRNDSGFLPPDTMGAVGQDHIVEMINGGFRIFDKNGNELESRSLNSFWTSRAGISITNFSFDPRIQFDASTNRWYAVAVDNARGDNGILLARSDTADPTEDWDGWRIDSDAGTGNRWADFPQLGFDNDGVYVTANMFDIDGGASLGTEVNVFIFPKTDLVNGSIANRTRIEDVIGTTGFAAQPVVYKDASEGASSFPPVFASADNNSINFSSLSGTINSPTVVNLSDTTVSTRNSPPLATQPDAVGTELDSGGNRIRSQVVFQNGDYYGVNGVDSGGQAAIRLFTISAGLGLERDQIVFGTGDRDFIYPSIDVNDDNDVVIGFTVTGPDNNPSGAFVAATEPAGGGNYSFPSFFFSFTGNDTYEALVGTRNRWGDYSATHFDPADPSYFWTFQEYAKGNNPSGNTGTWGTGIREVSPQGVVPGRLPRSLTFAESMIVPFGPTGSSDDVQAGDAFFNFRDDVDSFFINSDNSIRGNGSVLIRADNLNDPDIVLRMGLYDADTGILEAVGSNFFGDSTINFTLPSTSARYIVAVTNQLFDDVGNTPTGNIDLDVTWNGSFDGSNILLDSNGDGVANTVLGPSEDSDFYQVTAPATATGNVTFTYTPSASLDGNFYIFDSSGDIVARVQSGGTGVVETVTLNDVTPGTEFFVTVQSSQFATTGTGPLTVNFVTAAIPATPAQPDLASGSDSGVSSSDNITNDTTPTFTGSGAGAFRTVRLFRGNVLIATGTSNLFGNWTLTPAAAQPQGTNNYRVTLAASPTATQSAFSSSLPVTIDTVGPSQSNFFFSFNSVQDHRFFVDFNEAVFGFTAGDLIVENLSTGSTVPSGDFTFNTAGGATDAIYNPTAGNDVVPDGDYRIRVPAARLTDAAGNANSTFSGADFFLNGDANRDRRVDLQDFLILRANFNDPGTFTSGDFTYDGVVNLQDFLLLRGAFNNALSAPPPALFGGSTRPAGNSLLAGGGGGTSFGDDEILA